MNLRRVSSSLLAAVALTGGLAACGGGDDDPVAAQSDTAAATAAEAPPAATAGQSGVDAMAGNTSPGTGADAYSSDDPFIAGNVKVPDLPKTISAAGLAFTKSSYTARAGEVWTFNNADIAIHNVQTDDAVKNPAKFKSPDANPGQKVKFTIPNKVGKYQILCYYHQSMTATLKVQK